MLKIVSGDPETSSGWRV